MKPFPAKARKFWGLSLIWSLFKAVSPDKPGASGTAWTCSTPPWKAAIPSSQLGPSARFASAMGYDENTGMTVLFGGTDIHYEIMNDTWVWDGVQWTDMTPVDSSDSPAPIEYAKMAYAGPGKGMLLFGGENLDYADKTWLWDGTKWNDVTPADTTAGYPSPRIEFSLAYIGNGEVLLYGGFGPRGALRDTWIWNGTGWRDATPTDPHDSPTILHRTSMAYDRKNDEVVLFGGYTDTEPYHSNTTWIWDRQKWSLQAPAASPPPRVFASLAYDSNIGKTILVGGEATYISKKDVWLWDGENWTEQTEANLPELSLSNLIYDARRGQSVIFSGYKDDTLLDTTWMQRISSVSNVSATLNNAGDSAADWSVAFKTGAFGNLQGKLDTITVQAPDGAALSPSSGDYAINGVPAVTAVQTAANHVTLVIPQDICAHTQVTVTLNNFAVPEAISNPADGFAVATSQDIVWAYPSNGDLEPRGGASKASPMHSAVNAIKGKLNLLPGQSARSA